MFIYVALKKNVSLRDMDILLLIFTIGTYLPVLICKFKALK